MSKKFFKRQNCDITSCDQNVFGTLPSFPLLTIWSGAGKAVFHRKKMSKKKFFKKGRILISQVVIRTCLESAILFSFLQLILESRTRYSIKNAE